jgi:hypothetical protein
MIEHGTAKDAPHEHLDVEPLAHDIFEHVPRLQVLQEQSGSHGNDVTARRWHGEHLVQALTRIRFDHQNAPAGVGEHLAEKRGDQRLAYTTFAGHDDQLPPEQRDDSVRKERHSALQPQ